MAAPRFLFTARVIAPTADGGAAGVAWRLVGGNNHELGRSHAVFPDFTACLDAVDGLRSRADALEHEVATATGPAGWGWRVLLDGEPVAVSSRWYRRAREGDYNLAQFLAAVPVAAVTAIVGAQPVRRELLRPDFVLPHLVLDPLDHDSEVDALEPPVLELGDQYDGEAPASLDRRGDGEVAAS